MELRSGADLRQRDIEVPVLIVGGGGAGLTASMLLEQLQIDTLLVNALPTTSLLPKAHVLNQRTMEIFDDLGIAEDIYTKSTPAENMAAMAWYAGFLGPHDDYGRRIGKVETWGAGYTNLNWMAASPLRSANLPQIRLEPILKAHAETMAPGRVRFRHQLVALEQDSAGMTARIRNHTDGTDYSVRAKYLLGCDGGRTVPKLAGIDYDGFDALGQMTTAHVTADLSQLAGDPDVLLRWTWCPDIGEMAVLVPMGPDHWGPDSEEWAFHITYLNSSAKDLSNEQIEATMRKALGIGDLPMQVHQITRWAIDSLLAKRFRAGRVFLLGDAAHRHPPSGGLGLTSATQDAHNLCWKLAAVLRGHAGEALLDSYEPERKPVAARNIQRSMENAVAHLAAGQAVGLHSDATPEHIWAQIRRLWSGKPEDAEHRRMALRAIRQTSMEGNELNVEYGYRYTSTAVIPDGSPQPSAIDDIRLYDPDTRPGSPLPHAWIDDEEGQRRPIKDLVQPGRFLLIAGEEGKDWCEAAHHLAEANSLPLDALRIGHLDGDFYDPRLAWEQHRGITSTGALLVRPDRVIAWRSLGATPDVESELAAALFNILCTNAKRVSLRV